MSKNTIYLIATILALIIVALVMSPKKPDTDEAANPANGLVAPAPTDAAAPPAGAAPAAPAGQAPATTAPDAAAPKSMDADEVPAGAEVTGEGAAPAPGAPANPASPTAPTNPAPDMAVPPSEGQ